MVVVNLLKKKNIHVAFYVARAIRPRSIFFTMKMFYGEWRIIQSISENIFHSEIYLWDSANNLQETNGWRERVRGRREWRKTDRDSVRKCIIKLNEIKVKYQRFKIIYNGKLIVYWLTSKMHSDVLICMQMNYYCYYNIFGRHLSDYRFLHNHI